MVTGGECCWKRGLTGLPPRGGGVAHVPQGEIPLKPPRGGGRAAGKRGLAGWTPPGLPDSTFTEGWCFAPPQAGLNGNGGGGGSPPPQWAPTLPYLVRRGGEVQPSWAILPVGFFYARSVRKKIGPHKWPSRKYGKQVGGGPRPAPPSPE